MWRSPRARPLASVEKSLKNKNTIRTSFVYCRDNSTGRGEVFILENMSIYENIGRRTGGDIYIGVVGPVRVGKSTFIKRFMDLMVIPNVKNRYERERIDDGAEVHPGGSRRSGCGEHAAAPCAAGGLCRLSGAGSTGGSGGWAATHGSHPLG